MKSRAMKFNMKIDQETVTFEDIGHWEELAKRALGQSDAVFDCSGVRNADSALLALILKWLQQAQQQKLQAKIVNLPEGMWSLAKLYGVRELIRPYCEKTSTAQI